MKNKKLSTLPIGTLFLAIALLMGRFLPETNLRDFISGFLVGLSIVVNLSYVFNRSVKIINL